MKKIILSVLLLTFSVSAGIAEDALSKLSEIQVKSMFCKKWKLTFLEYKGKQKEIPGKVPQSLLIFLQDGKLQEFEGTKKYDGTWSYQHDNKTITTIDQDGTEKHKIIDLTSDQFVMNGNYKGFTFNMGFKRVD